MGATANEKFQIALGSTFSTDVEMFLYNEGYITWNRKDGLLESRITNDVSSLKSWSKEQAIEYVYVSKVPAEIEENSSSFANSSIALS